MRDQLGCSEPPFLAASARTDPNRMQSSEAHGDGTRSREGPALRGHVDRVVPRGHPDLSLDDEPRPSSACSSHVLALERPRW